LPSSHSSRIQRPGNPARGIKKKSFIARGPPNQGVEGSAMRAEYEDVGDKLFNKGKVTGALRWDDAPAE